MVLLKRTLKASLVILTLALTCILPKSAGQNVEPAKGGTIVPIVRAGDPASDIPLLGFNNDGQVAFLDVLSGTPGGRSSSRIAIGSTKGLTEIVRTGQPTPDSNGSFSAHSVYRATGGEFFSPIIGSSPGFQSFDIKCGISFPQGSSYKDSRGAFPNSFNNKGQVAFLDTLIGTSGGEDDNIGIFLSGASSIRQIARAGQSIPDRSGVFSGFSLPVVNDNGDVAFAASIRDSDVRLSARPAENCTVGIFLARNGMLAQVARSSRAPILEKERFEGFLPPVINNKGQMAFVGYHPGLSLTVYVGSLYLANGSTPVELANAGQVAPDGNGKFVVFSNPAINDKGQVAFQSILTETREGDRDNKGIFLATAGRVVQIARSGQPAPDGSGTVLDVSVPLLNNEGQVTFGVTYTGSTPTRIQDTAIMRGTAGGELRQIARTGFPGADRNGRVAAIGPPRINNKGQIAFGASFIEAREPGEPNTGIYFVDGETLVEVVRPGEPAPGEKSKFAAIGPPLINDFGQIAFVATVTGTDREAYKNAGIYIWSPVKKK